MTNQANEGTDALVKGSATELLIAYLSAHNTLTLATARDGKPFACSLFYVNDSLTLYFVSEPTSRHAENVILNPQVSVTVHEDYRDWRSIQGIQLEGECTLVSNLAESLKALALYTKKFPFVSQLGAEMTKVKFFKITLRWARYIDNTRRFGFKEEINFVQ